MFHLVLSIESISKELQAQRELDSLRATIQNQIDQAENNSVLNHIIWIACFVGGILIIGWVVWSIFNPKKEEKAWNAYMKHSMEDEYIIDPETGAKLTLEQAESGHWVQHDNLHRQIPKEDIDKLWSEQEKESLRSINYIVENKDYSPVKMNAELVDFLEGTYTLRKYFTWSYSKLFKMEYADGFVLLPHVDYRHHEVSGRETQIMFILNLNDSLGHVYLREQTVAEMTLSFLSGRRKKLLKGYEAFLFNKDSNIIKIKKILEPLEKPEDVEIEFFGSYLCIKNRKLIRREEFDRMESYVKQIVQN